MKESCSFIEFLYHYQNTSEVPSILNEGIQLLQTHPIAEPSNLFSVSQYFMRHFKGKNTQKILEALIFSYQRWILYNLWNMIPHLERCMSANRIVFIEDLEHMGKDDKIWEEINHQLNGLAATIQDLMATSQVLAKQMKQYNFS